MNTLAAVLIAWAILAIGVGLYLARRIPPTTAAPPFPTDALHPGRVFLVDPTGRTWSVVQVTHDMGTGHRAAYLTVILIPTPETPGA